MKIISRKEGGGDTPRDKHRFSPGILKLYVPWTNTLLEKI